ncbi:hypothetical protein FACS1894188_09010 [Clostridia bacterium]|nr:hypothetical protein FACS1894188_09010 [Clostridia bacterium]
MCGAGTETSAIEFELSQEQYKLFTGRDQGNTKTVLNFIRLVWYNGTDEDDRLKPQEKRKKPMQPQAERHTGKLKTCLINPTAFQT